MSPRLDRFTCEEMFRRLDMYLDRELTSEEMVLVRSHLETCAVCASEYAFEESMLQAIRLKLQRIQIAPSLVEKVRAAVSRAENDMRT